ncbi:MAG: hypothetical protein M3X11_03690 [Acidobacteriota bacterium]|nr:hypothetical protein [Acidobacteriota bacterium]
MTENLFATDSIADEAALDELRALGYTRETIELLQLVPPLRVAWAEGFVTPQEAERIFEAAHSREVAEGSPAWQQLSAWLNQHPSEEFFDKSLLLIGHLLQALPEWQRKNGRTRLIADCLEVANASDGREDSRSRISEVEMETMETITVELRRASWGTFR